MEPKKIYEVATYLRKSRDDTGGEEDVLLKHETALTDLVRKNNWRYVIYREIGRSDSIHFCPEFKRLVKDIENDFYDAVVVMDYDRLSCGDKEDRARVEKTLQQSNTLVVTL
ncbi:recombinase family protein [Alicyclobacillus sp. SP_1]|uniref:recombinase family protein n=1 Tax=Alicyclobacillus sp. SP_1 TaxID=2942475 RepID=UPI002157F1E6|nr:recombinase family protein [Alicyclobacillus sp. SP_1]